MVERIKEGLVADLISTFVLFQCLTYLLPMLIILTCMYVNFDKNIFSFCANKIYIFFDNVFLLCRQCLNFSLRTINRCTTVCPV